MPSNGLSPYADYSKGYFTNKAKLTSPAARARNSLVGVIVVMCFTLNYLWQIYG